MLASHIFLLQVRYIGTYTAVCNVRNKLKKEEEGHRERKRERKMGLSVPATNA